ncbi:hypothetical protein TNCV_755881 [Trichonephila clavipes]|nr:hypothetical protein TNCV_755881 [Trichonephila clavipes]
MHLGEKTEDMPTQRDKPSNLGEKTEDTSELNENSPPILVRKQRICQLNETSPPILVDGKKSKVFKHFPLVRALDDDEAFVSLGQVTKLAPDAERQVFEGYRYGQVALQAKPFIDVPVGPAVFGSRKEIRVVHRDTNHFRVFAIFRNAGNGQFDRDRLATMVKHVGMVKKG